MGLPIQIVNELNDNIIKILCNKNVYLTLYKKKKDMYRNHKNLSSGEIELYDRMFNILSKTIDNCIEFNKNDYVLFLMKEYGETSDCAIKGLYLEEDGRINLWVATHSNLENFYFGQYKIILDEEELISKSYKACCKVLKK